MRFDDPYEILGLKKDASDEEIRAAYEKLLNEEDKKEEAEAAYAQICTLRENPSEEEENQEESSDASSEETEEDAEEASDEETSQETEDSEEDNTELKKGSTPGQIALGVLAVVVLAAVLIALIVAAMGSKDAPAAEDPANVAVTMPAMPEAATVPADGEPGDVTCKGTYTVADEDLLAAADTVVASMGDFQLTNAQLQIYYWMGIKNFYQSYGPYIQSFGLNPSLPLDVQPCGLEEGLTWQQYFLRQALQDWQLNQAMAIEANAAGAVIPEDRAEILEKMPEDIEAQAKESGFENGQALLANNVGAAAEIQDYIDFLELFEIGYSYLMDATSKATPTEEEMEAYYTEHEAELKEGGISKDAKVVSVRHILIAPESQDSEENWTTAEQNAQKILDTFLSGDQTEESFGKLAAENTMDPGSMATGGLYEDVFQGQMVPEFDQWCFDAERKPGDTGIVKTQYGYHIMYYVSSRTVWMEQVSQIMVREFGDNLLQNAVSEHPMDVDYSSIVLGTLKEQ